MWLKIGRDKGGGTFKMAIQIVNIRNPNAPKNTCVADTGRKRTLFHCKWANSISYISECFIEITPDFLCPFMND